MANDSPRPAAQPPWVRRLSDALLPAVLLAFVALYLLGLAAQVEPELALGRAAVVTLLLAILARVARGVLESLESTPSQPGAPSSRLDVTIGDAPTDHATDADGSSAAQAPTRDEAGVPVGSN